MRTSDGVDGRFSRRGLLTAGAAAAGLAARPARARQSPPAGSPPAPVEIGSKAAAGLFVARPGKPSQRAITGLFPLGLGTQRDGYRCVPLRAVQKQPSPLLLFLHGAGGDALLGLDRFRQHAEAEGFVLLSVDSRGRTWDGRSVFGPDVEFIDRALDQTFSRHAIDPKRIAIAGFSDGASYALSPGLANGELFTHVMAFAPGFLRKVERRGKPRIFVSHGTQDDVLPIDATSRRLVPQLQQEGYEVRYREFDGRHDMPHAIVREAVGWFLGKKEPGAR